MSFRRVGAVILLVSNMAKSTKFYGEVLGLPLKNRSEDWTEFFKDGAVLALHPAKKKSGLKAGTGMLVGFMVSDLDSTAKRLKEKKVKFFKKPKQEPFGKHAIIQDPDGHLISIAEMKPKSTDAEGFDLLGLIGAE
jgi:predicted enzyme related to lactoylglutathione lyase